MGKRNPRKKTINILEKDALVAKKAEQRGFVAFSGVPIGPHGINLVAADYNPAKTYLAF